MSYPYRRQRNNRLNRGNHTWERAADADGAGITWPVDVVAGVGDALAMIAGMTALLVITPDVVPARDLAAWLTQLQPALAAAQRVSHSSYAVRDLAGKLNALVVMLLGDSNDLDQFRRRWAAIGEAISQNVREEIPEHLQVSYYRKVKSAIETSTLVQVMTSNGPLTIGQATAPTGFAGMASPALLTTGNVEHQLRNLASSGGPSGGGLGNRPGGGNWYDGALDGLKKGASVGAVGGPGGAAWGAAIGAAAGLLGVTNPEASTGEEAITLFNRAYRIYQGDNSALLPDSSRPTQTGQIGGQPVPGALGSGEPPNR